jgi:NADH-quinone oxidoreductase subunit K
MTWESVGFVFIGAFVLLGISWYGLFVTRNLIKIVLVLQIMVKSALLLLVAAGEASGQINLSQSMVLTVIVADTIVAVIGLAMAVQVMRLTGSLDVADLAKLKG